MKKELKSIIKELVKVNDKIEDIKEGQNNKFDSLSEASQDGKLGEKITDIIERLDAAHEMLGAAIDEFDEILNLQ